MRYRVDPSTFRRGPEIAAELGLSREELSKRAHALEFGWAFAMVGGELLLPAKGVSDTEFSVALDYLMAERHFPNGGPAEIASSEELGDLPGRPIQVILPDEQNANGKPNCAVWLLGRTLFFGSPPSSINKDSQC